MESHPREQPITGYLGQICTDNNIDSFGQQNSQGEIFQQEPLIESIHGNYKLQHYLSSMRD